MLDNKSLVSSANYLTDLNSMYSKNISIEKNNMFIPNGIQHTIEATIGVFDRVTSTDDIINILEATNISSNTDLIAQIQNIASAIDSIIADAIVANTSGAIGSDIGLNISIQTDTTILKTLNIKVKYGSVVKYDIDSTSDNYIQILTNAGLIDMNLANNINDVVGEVIPNIDEILLVDDKAAQVSADTLSVTEMKNEVTAMRDTVVSKEELISQHYVNIDTVAGSIVNVNNVADSINNVNSVAINIVPNIVEILDADTNAQIATSKAAEASESQLLAKRWASENEDVVVLDGKYSARHYALKAEYYSQMSDSSIDDSAPSGIHTYSSSKIENELNKISTHTSRVDNPHGVSKTQVGLGNVLNVDSTNPNNIVQDSTHRFVTDSDKTNWNGKINVTEKAVANGVATLDVNGKVVLTQIPDSVLGQLKYMGIYSFSGGMPTATQKGQYWIASADGNGYITGDWAVWNGTSFDKVDNTDAVATVAGRTGNVVLTKNDVGLANVDNTSDANKPVSTAQQTALNLKANIASPTFTGTVTAPTLTISGTGTITTRVSSVAADLTAVGRGTTNPIHIPMINVGTTYGYIPMISTRVVSSAGYINNNSIGSYRPEFTWANSGVYIATGENDEAPTEAFLFQNGRKISSTGGAITLVGNADTATNVNWSGVTSKPTTLSGYGITDAYTSSTIGTLAEFTAALG